MSMSGREKREQLLAMAEEVKAKYVEEGESYGSLGPDRSAQIVRSNIDSLGGMSTEYNRLIDDLQAN